MHRVQQTAVTPRLFAQADPSAPQRQPALLLLLIQLGVGACSVHLLPFGRPVCLTEFRKQGRKREWKGNDIIIARFEVTPHVLPIYVRQLHLMSRSRNISTVIKEGILENRIFDRPRMRFFVTLAWPNLYCI